MKHAFEATVAVGGQDCGEEYDQRDCELIAQAFTRAAKAMADKDSGMIDAINANGTNVASLTVFDRNKERDENYRPWKWRLAKYSDHKPKRKKAKK